MGDPAVSVVVPTYERPDLLGRLLGALAVQVDAPPFEVVVVDDGSSVDLGPVVDAHPFARLVRQANAGPATARNRGWREAQAGLVAFTDDDTEPRPDWLARLVAAADRTGADGIGGGIVARRPGFLADFVQAERHVDHGREDDGSVRYLVTANAAFRRPVLEALGGFDEGFPGASGEDTDLSLRARAAGYRLVLAPDAIVAHEHRVPPRAILRTYRKHGRSRRLVVSRNPAAGWGARRRRMATPAYWLGRWRYYRREGAGVGRATAYTAMHAVGLASYVLGILDSRRAGAAGSGSPASGVTPLRVAVLCAGLDHVRRGYESFSRELVVALRDDTELDVVLLKGSGPSGGGERRVRTLRRDGRLARSVARLPGWRGGGVGAGERGRLGAVGALRATLAGRLVVQPYEVEQVGFAVSVYRHCRRVDVVLVSDVLVAKLLRRLRSTFGGDFGIVFSNGAPWPPPYGFADVVQHVTGPALEGALAAGEPADRQRLVPYGIALPPARRMPDAASRAAARAALGLPADRSVVLSVGALNVHHKRHDHTVAALAASGVDATLVLLGAEEDETSRVRAAAAALGDRAVLRSVPASEVDRYYEAADVFVLASLREGFGRVLVEAQAWGLPVLVHDDLPEVRWVLGELGTYVDMTDVEATARAIEAALRAGGPGERGFRVARERFAWEAVGPAYRDLLREVVGR